MGRHGRMRCGLPAWNSRGREMVGRTSAIKKNVMALDRLAVTIMVTEAERAEFDTGASGRSRLLLRRPKRETA